MHNARALVLENQEDWRNGEFGLTGRIIGSKLLSMFNTWVVSVSNAKPRVDRYPSINIEYLWIPRSDLLITRSFIWVEVACTFMAFSYWTRENKLDSYGIVDFMEKLRIQQFCSDCRHTRIRIAHRQSFFYFSTKTFKNAAQRNNKYKGWRSMTASPYGYRITILW